MINEVIILPPAPDLTALERGRIWHYILEMVVLDGKRSYPYDLDESLFRLGDDAAGLDSQAETYYYTREAREMYDFGIFTVTESNGVCTFNINTNYTIGE